MNIYAQHNDRHRTVHNVYYVKSYYYRCISNTRLSGIERYLCSSACLHGSYGTQKNNETFSIIKSCLSGLIYAMSHVYSNDEPPVTRPNSRSPTQPGFLRVIVTDVAFLWPIVALLIALVVAQLFQLDHRLADTLYALEGHHWALRGHWLTSHVLHRDAQKFSIAIGVVTLGLVIASNFWQRLKPYRRGLIATFVGAITSLLLVSLLKHQLPLACPWDLQRYGGDLIGDRLFELRWQQDPSGCFPAGHAAGGYVLLVWFFFARRYQLPGYRWAWLPGLLIGLVFGIDQELRGAHFLSHDLAAILLCWVVSYIVFHAIAGWHKPAQSVPRYQ